MMKMISGQELEILPFEQWNLEKLSHLNEINDRIEGFGLTETLDVFLGDIYFAEEKLVNVSGAKEKVIHVVVITYDSGYEFKDYVNLSFDMVVQK
ncbi:MAG: hypothetical protein ACRCZZ_08860 [Phocaeicola sp.]